MLIDFILIKKRVRHQNDQSDQSKYLHNIVSFQEFDAGLFHVVTDSVSHVLIKSSQKNRPNHDCRVITETMQETSTLQ